MIFKCTDYLHSISGTAPEYLSDLLQPYTPARQLRSASDTRTFVTPRVNTKTFGERSFSYAGPSVWNNLPQTLRHSDSAPSFKAALKTHRFNNYCDHCILPRCPISCSDCEKRSRACKGPWWVCPSHSKPGASLSPSRRHSAE